MGTSGAIQALYLKILTQKNFVVEFYRENVNFIRKIASSVFEPHYGEHRNNICDSYLARWKASYGLLITEHFC